MRIPLDQLRIQLIKKIFKKTLITNAEKEMQIINNKRGTQRRANLIRRLQSYHFANITGAKNIKISEDRERKFEVWVTSVTLHGRWTNATQSLRREGWGKGKKTEGVYGT